MKTWYTVKAAKEGSDTAEVHILEEIGFWGIGAKQYLADFRAIKAEKVALYINSPGGSVFEAVAMFNGMRATGKDITVHVLGIAASAASYIAMVGNKIVMPKNTMMFLHNPINGVYGNADDMRDMADILDKIGTSLTATYAKRFKGEAKVLEALMADEAYLTADECLAHGLCDEVVDEIAATALFDVERLPENVQALFKAAVKPPVDAPASPLADSIVALAKERGLEAYASVFVTDPLATTLDAARQAMNVAAEIVALAKHTGLPEQAAPLIRARTSIDAARASLAAVLAKADEAAHIDTAAKAKSLQASPEADWSPTSMWTDIRAMKAGSKK